MPGATSNPQAVPRHDQAHRRDDGDDDLDGRRVRVGEHSADGVDEYQGDRDEDADRVVHTQERSSR